MSNGRPKGGTNKYWSAKDKEKIILECIENNLGSSRASKNMEYQKVNFIFG